MAQIFHPSMKVVSRASIAAFLVIIAVIGWAAAAMYRSPYFTAVNIPVEQPVQFSHEHHVSGLGISCLYCHTSVEQAASAGIPSTHTCMTCHSQIWATSPMLAPVRASYRSNRPLEWTRVHDLPDFAYFNHSIHLSKGIGCQTCHGDVQRMPLVWKTESLYMQWCLDCHREPERYIRPREEVLNMSYVVPLDQAVLGPELVRAYDVRTAQLDDCSICHR